MPIITAARNPKYSKPDNSLIDIEVQVDGEWFPFTANPNDVEAYGRVLHQKALDGEFGLVQPYEEPE